MMWHTAGRRALVTALLLGSAQLAVAPLAEAQASVVVASKPFGESYLLAEMFAQQLEAAGVPVVRRPGFGATELVFGALRRNDVDVYPEYVGTGLVAILHDTVTAEERRDPRLAYAHVARESRRLHGVSWLPPLGFQNGYAIAVAPALAERLHLRTLSDVAAAGPTLRAGFTSDFIGRADGWPGVSAAYGMRMASVKPLAASLKYQAVAAGAVDIIDGYATDGLLARYGLVVLEDDRRFFPPYDAVAVVSPRLASTNPRAIAALVQLSGRFTERQVREWNRRIEVDGEAVPVVAASALAALGLGPADTSRATSSGSVRATWWQRAWQRRGETGRLVLEHLGLVALALGAAILVAVPGGLWLAARPSLADPLLLVLGSVQTIPGLALLALLVPLVGIGAAPALLALWAYGLLPIAQATIAGVRAADPEAVRSLEAMGATRRQLLWWARVPLAAPVILSGIRTSAVLTVGTATLAAFVGGGGLGEPIITGLALADMQLVLGGAVPAAVLALTVDAMLAWVARRFTPAHVRT